MNRQLFFPLLLIFILSGWTALAQQEIQGTIRDFSTNETLIGATVGIKGTTINTVTDNDGKFLLTTTESFPLTLTITYVGYAATEVAVRKPGTVNIRLKSNTTQLGDVQIRSSRISEKQKESPLTVESMDMIAIKETPAANFYEGLGQLKGVDLTSAALGFKVINTRGFNSTSPVRSLQLIDGVDNQSPGLNFSLGNFLGAPELDIQRVELIVGASSAYYGPNAFNGVISMSTRSPFTKPGLEVSVKVGERQLFETSLRWAQVLKNKKGEEKFGYKINLFYFRAYDWEADNLSPTPQSRSGRDNPGGYDAVNVYGDEFISGTDYSSSPGFVPGLGVFYRKGYREKDLVDYNTRNGKASVALHYKIKSDVEAIVASNFSTGTTVYQGDNRYSLKEVMFFQHRIELRKPNKWFIRAYATHEDAGKSYDAYFTALQLQRAAKQDGYFKQDYENYWSTNYGLPHIRTFPNFPQPPSTGGPAYVEWLESINPFLLANYRDSLVKFHQAAQAYANGMGGTGQPGIRPYLEPGTAAFDTTFAGIISRKSFGENGTRFYDRSALYHIQGEYRFKPAFCDVVTGGNFRLYTPNSAGTIFSDTGNVKIRNWEAGVYAGAEKRVMAEKLKINLTARLDKNQNFPLLFSPAASLVYEPGKEQYLRLSFSSAIRNPTLADQYLYYNTGRAILIGNKDGLNGLVTIPSLIRTYDLNKNLDSLSYFNVKPVRPEQVRTLEAGYRATLFERLYLDVSGYYSWYKDFIGYKIGAQVDTFRTVFGSPELNVRQVFRVATNSEDVVTTYGISAGLNYYIGKHFAALVNYSWNRLDRLGSTDPLIPAFNTPEHKFNLGFNGRDFHHFGFSVNYKWVEGFNFEGSPQFTGQIDSYGLLDVQVNRRFPKMYSTLKIGASNLLNNLHYEVYGGPLIGRLAYASLLVDLTGLK